MSWKHVDHNDENSVSSEDTTIQQTNEDTFEIAIAEEECRKAIKVWPEKTAAGPDGDNLSALKSMSGDDKTHQTIKRR